MDPMPSVLRDPHHLEIVQEARRPRTADSRPFDRQEFARQVLEILQPPRWTVAFYLRDGEFYLDRGRDLREGTDAVWAILGIPKLATRAEIAVTIAELTGTTDKPFLVDLLAAEP